MSEIRRPLSPINLPLTEAVWPRLIKTGRTFLSFIAKVFFGYNVLI